MGTAYEIRTAKAGPVIRKAYRLDPPFVAPTYDDEDEPITATTEYVVLSNNLPLVGRDHAEVMAFPGTHRRLFGVDTVSITDMAEVAALKGVHRTRALLAEMGYETVIDLAGRKTVRTERGEENHGRWGQGAPGSDDYMSFGE